MKNSPEEKKHVIEKIQPGQKKKITFQLSVKRGVIRKLISLDKKNSYIQNMMFVEEMQTID